MKKNKIVIKFRRYRSGQTDYQKRLKFLKSGITRIVVRKTLKNMIVQFVEYNATGDKILFAANSRSLDKFGWKYKKNNLPAAYLTGLLVGLKAKSTIKNTIVDLGRVTSTKGSKLYAVVKGIIDAGINVPVSKEILPSMERIKGEHISSYAKKVKTDDSVYKKLFSSYIKNKVSPENMSSVFEDVKTKISAKKSE